MYSEAGEVDELVVIVLGELVKDLVPLRVVISQSAHVGDLQPVLLAECRRIHDGVLVDGGAGVVSFKLFDEFGGSGLLPRAGRVITVGVLAINLIASGIDLTGGFVVMLREGTSPIGTGQIGHFRIGSRIEQVVESEANVVVSTSVFSGVQLATMVLSPSEVMPSATVLPLSARILLTTWLASVAAVKRYCPASRM